MPHITYGSVLVNNIHNIQVLSIFIVANL